MLKINLDAIAFENIEDWSPFTKSIAISLSCCFLLLLLYWVDISSELHKLHNEQVKEKNLRKELIVKQREVSNFKAHHAQLIQAQQMLSVMMQQLPARNEVPLMIESITKIAGASGVIIKQIKPLTEWQHEFFIELPIQITAIGTFYQLMQFFNQIAVYNKIVNLNNFLLTVANEGVAVSKNSLNIEHKKLQISIVAKLYLPVDR